ncbi:MAG TPA: CDP-glycerol glycerophosphotransferase family protein, partial [Microbacteriaceae bacterium]|nr:CDP-glycerol glycerophosphotransferase family protein [Microbacteriaceae bacterium]
RRLGIRPGQQALLYAPTFRDYVSADDTRAEMIDFVDLGRLARRLGDDYVILLRGHPFNARSGTQAEGRVVNVTDYPDINDLIVASDLAVLDYSSLRFDYALTGKPAIFFVPDRERYFRGREGFLPYDETTPGPQITAAADLERAILDAPRLAAEHEEARRAFLSRFMELEDGHATQRLIDRVFGSVRGRDC